MSANLAHRILCIEDDSRLRRLLTEDLAEAGYDIIAADGAVTGIEAFFTSAPALVLCDVRMPGISGLISSNVCANWTNNYLVPLSFFSQLWPTATMSCVGGAWALTTIFPSQWTTKSSMRSSASVWALARPEVAGPPSAEYIEVTFRMDRSIDPGAAAGRLGRYIAGASIWPHGPHSERTAGSPDPDMFTGMVDGMPIGIVILDGEGTVQYVNESAATVLGRPRCELAGTRATAKLAAFARQHARFAHGRRICRHKRLELETAAEAVTAIARSAPAAPGDNCGRVTVLLPAVPKAQPVFGELLHALFGLTPAERGLATALSAGDHLCDIATNRGVALNTVRAQLKSVFGKVGVTSQSDLVRTLLTLQMAAGCAQP